MIKKVFLKRRTIKKQDNVSQGLLLEEFTEYRIKTRNKFKRGIS